MSLKRKLLCLTIWILAGLPVLFFAFNSPAYGQTNISGVINTVSANIDAVYSYDTSPGNIDSVHVSSVAGFSIGDTVLIHMTVGAEFYTDPDFLGQISFANNCGKYALFILKDIDVAHNYLILNSTLPGFTPLVSGEYGQILKVPTYKRAKITGTLTCNAYDTATHKGGILALIVKQGLIFEGDINVDGKGFPGADPDTNQYSGVCSSTDILFKEPYLDNSDVKYSALKGYSFTSTTNGLPRGFGAINNGGGGGFGLYSGGGGGANIGKGGDGGKEIESCVTDPFASGGMGGEAPATVFYQKTDNRINLGGGGGTSLQNLPDFRSTPGSNGGGIVIIICDSLIGNKNIYARGDSVELDATAGGGGGGGGGAIILHVNKYSNAPKLWVSGGKGGDISSSVSEPGGPGGGGGGGVIWHFESTMGGTGFNTQRGEVGKYIEDPRNASRGGSGAIIKNLKIPIRGFIFNYIPAADTICKNVPPNTINAAPAIGGADTLIYRWYQSSDAFNWVIADSTFDKHTYTPKASKNTTMYYKRFVTDNFIKDTSNIVKMYVLPLLDNNLVKPDNTTKFDTIVCSNLKAGTLKQLGPMSGGNGSYRYMWEKSTISDFNTRDTISFSGSYATPVLIDTSWWYRRTVYSGPRNRKESGVLNNTCKSTSNLIKITVLPVIKNNILSDSQEICTTRTPDELTGGLPTGGDNMYSYKWQQKTGPNAWSDVSTEPAYQPPALTVSREYRRIIYSGNANTCKDTSAAGTGKVIVMPDIGNNTIYPIVQNILCSGLAADTIKATNPSGGNGKYIYYWQKDGVNALSGTADSIFNPGILQAVAPKFYTFRNYVFSGINTDTTKRCWNISNERTISILDNILNNNLSAEKTVWCEGSIPDTIKGTSSSNLTGGNGIYAFSWVSKIPAGGWIDKTEQTQNYNPAVISSNISYRRIVKSGLNQTCKDTSNIIALVMQNQIRNNIINNGETVFVCFDQDSILQASASSGALTGGDETNYSYLWMQSADSLTNYVTASHSLNSNALYETEPIQTNWYFKRNVKSGDCENTSLPVQIKPLPLPELTSLTVSRENICFSKLNSIINISIKSGLIPYTIGFEDGQGFNDYRVFRSGTGTIKPQMDDPPLNPGFIDYNFKVVSIKDSLNCYSKPSSLNTPLRVYTTPVPSLVGDSKVLACSDTLLLSVSNSIGNSSWHLKNIFGISATNTTSPTVKLTANYSTNDSASVSLVYVEDISNCHSDSVYLDAILYNYPDPVTDSSVYKVTEGIPIVAGDPVVIYISDNQQFRGRPIVSGIPGWSITGGGELTDNHSIETTINKLDQENPTFLEYSISNGMCPVNSRILKIERHNLYVYQGISPNGDGLNEKLWAIGLADEEVDFTFQIFSGSGNFIKEITRKDIREEDYNYGENELAIWDGTTILGGAGNYVPDGTYYYILLVTYHGAPFNEKGYIIVKR